MVLVYGVFIVFPLLSCKTTPLTLLTAFLTYESFGKGLTLTHVLPGGVVPLLYKLTTPFEPIHLSHPVSGSQ